MAQKNDSGDVLDLSDEEIKRRQRGRNIAVALCVVGFVVIIFAVTIVRIQTGIEASLGN